MEVSTLFVWGNLCNVYTKFTNLYTQPAESLGKKKLLRKKSRHLAQPSGRFLRDKTPVFWAGHQAKQLRKSHPKNRESGQFATFEVHTKTIYFRSILEGSSMLFYHLIDGVSVVWLHKKPAKICIYNPV